MRIQRPIKNRQKLYSGMVKQIKDRIESLAYQHDCSSSFVTNTILADTFGIKLEDKYYDYKRSNRNNRK